MTLVSSIINDALRETNINPLGKLPGDDQYAEGLTRLQSLVLSVLGNEAGDPLSPVPLGSNEIEAPAGYPGYENELPGKAVMPLNSRVMLNLTGAGTIYFHPKPHDGARMGVVDVSQNLNFTTCDIIGNGRSIEGDDAQTLNEAGLIREWLYRGDLGDWKRVTDLTLTSDSPFPREFDDMFIIMLAGRLNPRYGQTLDPASVSALQRSRSQFRARYGQNTQMPSEEGLLRLSGMYSRYNGYYNRYYGDTDSMFNSGYAF